MDKDHGPGVQRGSHQTPRLVGLVWDQLGLEAYPDFGDASCQQWTGRGEGDGEVDPKRTMGSHYLHRRIQMTSHISITSGDESAIL